MANKKSKSQKTRVRVNSRYWLMAAVAIGLVFLFMFLLTFAILAASIGNNGGSIGGLIVATLFSLVTAYVFMSRTPPQVRVGRRT